MGAKNHKRCSFQVFRRVAISKLHPNPRNLDRLQGLGDGMRKRPKGDEDYGELAEDS